MSPRPLLSGLAALALVATAASCASVDVPESLPGPTSSTTAAPEPPSDPPAGCTEETVTRSLRPSGPATTDVPADSYMATIRERGRLRVGVDTSTLLFSSVNPRTGEFEGFDVELAKEVAVALFGDPNAIELVAIPKSDRATRLLDPEDRPDDDADDDAAADDTVDQEPLDMVVDTFTVNCERAELIDFSSTYFVSHQRLLVRADEEATGIAGFAGRPVCAPTGSTSIRNLTELPDPPEAVGKPSQGTCLVALQQGEVDAVSTDDTILAGMTAQDPNLRIVGEQLSDEPYGIGLPPGHPEWVRYVNAVLEEVRSSGRWTQLYEQVFGDTMGDDADPTPPAAEYED